MFQLIQNRYNFVDIDEDLVQDLFDSSQRDGDWGKLSHLIALYVVIRIPIDVCNRVRIFARWETVPTELKLNCDPVQVKHYIDMV